MAALLGQKYEERFFEVKEEINAAEYTCFTADLWDAKWQKKSYLRLKTS
jgi:hypothetical protein